LTVNMVHKNCGGIISEDFSKPYRFEGEDAKVFGAVVPRYVCDKCKQEIVSDKQIAIED